MREKIKTLKELFEYSTIKFARNRQAASVDGAIDYTYLDFRRQCEGLSRKLSLSGVGAGDKVAILSQNMPNWTVSFFAATAFGRVAIPILAESSQNEVTNILTHSESKALLVSRKLLPQVSEEALRGLVTVLDIETFEEIKAPEGAVGRVQAAAPADAPSEERAKAQSPADALSEACGKAGSTATPAPQDLATIIYTSGTTGNAKGVMLSHWNLLSCVHSCSDCKKRDSNDRWLSILPMSHTLELSIGVLYPFLVGASVYYLMRPPVPALLLKAMQSVRPTTMLSVPLIIEKIHRDSIIPTIRKSPVLSWMQAHTPAILNFLIGRKLRETFGGCLTFFGIGGAKLNIETEQFLLDTRFPYAVGYGLTETAPLLTFTTGSSRTPGSIGQAVRGVELRLDGVNPATGEGEIVAKGPNVMMGYYKDPERTAEAFTADGWFKTRDLAVRDARGCFSIRGRLSNMILGAAGENIYPEEIEQVINAIDVVDESVVLSRENKLIALVTFNENVLDWDHEGEAEFLAKAEDLKRRILSKVNKNVNRTSHLSAIQILRDPFEKTATRKIRRFKYANVEGV